MKEGASVLRAELTESVAVIPLQSDVYVSFVIPIVRSKYSWMYQSVPLTNMQNKMNATSFPSVNMALFGMLLELWTSWTCPSTSCHINWTCVNNAGMKNWESREAWLHCQAGGLGPIQGGPIRNRFFLPWKCTRTIYNCHAWKSTNVKHNSSPDTFSP